MADISRDEIDRLYTTMDQGFRGVHTRLDMSNGRLGKAETEIAVLKDRSEKTSKQATDQAQFAGAIWGSVVGAVVAGVFEGIRWFVAR